MEYLVGASLALGISLCATVFGFDRDRVLYPFMAIVVASYYELFAAIAGLMPVVWQELLAFFAFAALGILGFKTNLWLVVAALAGHGLFDLAHPHLIINPGTPSWWPMFCMTYDIVAAGYLALLLRGATRPALVRVDHPIRPYVQAELDAARRPASRASQTEGFHNLERAHVLSQVSTREHVRVHWRMMIWAMQQRDVKEFAGQLVRIVGAATKTAFGLVPSGNTGGANVSPFRPMPIAEDIAAILAKTAAK